MYKPSNQNDVGSISEAGNTHTTEPNPDVSTGTCTLGADAETRDAPHQNDKPTAGKKCGRPPKGKPYKPGKTRHHLNFEGVLAHRQFESHKDKLRNRYKLTSTTPRARNCGSASYARSALIRILDATRLNYAKSGDNMPKLLLQLIKHDSFTVTVLDSRYASADPVRNLRIDEFKQAITNRKLKPKDLIEALYDCVLQNFKYSDHKEKLDEYQARRLKLAIERALKPHFAKGIPDRDEWVRYPGGTKTKAECYEDAKLVQVKIA